MKTSRFRHGVLRHFRRTTAAHQLQDRQRADDSANTFNGHLAEWCNADNFNIHGRESNPGPPICIKN